MDKASSRGSGKADEERGCEWGGGENQNCTPQLPQEEPCPSSAPVGPQLTWGTLPTQASCPEDQSSGARTCSPPAEPRASVNGHLEPKTTRPCGRLPAAAWPEPLAMSDSIARSHPVQAQLRKRV